MDFLTHPKLLAFTPTTHVSCGAVRNFLKQVIIRSSILGVMALAGSAFADPVNYMKEIKPVLSTACYQCHSETQQKHGLRVDTAASILKGGQSGPAIIPGNSADSLLVKAVQGTAKDLTRMPFKKGPLEDEKIALLKRWIDEGAHAPADEKPDAVKHWSFVAVGDKIPVPTVKNKKWVRTPVDNFILAKLEKEKLKPAPEANRITLIRRLYLDLLGLPPKIEEIDAFLKDKRPNAYEELVDRLLANPHYGERWARHWLDAAHYADSNGYSIDGPREIWKYRDWVINAFNRDLPFDQFTVEQIAGDLLPNAGTEEKVATGFYRNTMINQEGGIDKEQFRIESIFDRINTTGSTWLGLTIGCAQCHDHKFDPIAQKEYYQFFAFLNNQDEPELQIASESDKEQIAALKQEMETLESELKDYIQDATPDVLKWQKGLSPEEVAHLSSELTQILETPPEKRTLKQNLKLVDQVRKDDRDYKNRKSKFLKLEKKKPNVTTTMVMQERTDPRDSFIFIKGDFTRHGEKVTPAFPKLFSPAWGQRTNLNRLDLAKWLVDPQNPLTARVAMNRVWMRYFGKGLVETDNDFGTQGSPATNQDLLDWLAREFMNQKWSLKAMHRMIVTSSTYRQSSNVRPELKDADPYNKWLARQNRFRLEAEMVRDVELAASGLLSEKIGGPSVFPPIPDGVMTVGQVKREWKVSPGDDKYRRGMYTFFYRATPPPALVGFDAPDATSVCTRRIRSNTPLQSLTLLNEQAFVDLAQGLTLRVFNEAPANEPARIDYAFRLCVGRPPEKDEKDRLLKLLQSEIESFVQAPDEAKELAPKKLPQNADVKQLAAWTTVSRVLLNLDETISRE